MLPGCEGPVHVSAEVHDDDGAVAGAAHHQGIYINGYKLKVISYKLSYHQCVAQARTEAEECHRLTIAALNGLAGVDIIEEKWADAVEK